jgi:hypothetical protein
MNKRQQAVMDKVRAEGGKCWIEHSMTMYHTRGATTEGRGMYTAADTLLAEKAKEYCPGGFRRETKLRLLEEEKVERYILNDPKGVWIVTINRMLVEVI